MHDGRTLTRLFAQNGHEMRLCVVNRDKRRRLRRKVQRERERREQVQLGPEEHEQDKPAEPGRDATHVWLPMTLMIVGCAAAVAWHRPVATALDQLYCTPLSCVALPQALTAWAIAALPLLVALWRLTVAIYVGLFAGCFMLTFVLAAGQDGSVGAGLWVLGLTYVLAGMLFVPLSIGISRLFRPSRRVLAMAVQHWLLLTGLIIWLA